MSTKPNFIPTENSTIPTAYNFSDKTILHLLNTKCTTSLQILKQVHAIAIRITLSRENYVAGTLVKLYAANKSCNSLESAITVFHQVPNPNTFLWNCIMKACLENDDPSKAISFYYDMVVSNSRRNKYTYPILFKACVDAKEVELGVQGHAHVEKNGLRGDKHIKSAGIKMYASFGYMNEARLMLDVNEGASDSVCWNALIDAYLKCGDLRTAKELFDEMPERNTGSWNVMIDGFARHGMIEPARDIFNCTPQKDEITWSAMIDGYIKGGYHKEALEIFHLMQKEDFKPKKFMLSSVLAACANVGALDQGRWIHAYIARNSIPLDAILGTSLVDMYAKCGCLDMAWDVFQKMKETKIFTWNAMITGLAIHGRANDAIDLFSKVLNIGMKPNEITFLGVLNACAHNGLVDKGLEFFNLMNEVYKIEPKAEHYGCLADLLGRAGLLKEAEQLINSMPMKPNAAIWGALLGACKIHGDISLGERVGEILLEMDPQNSGRYVLLSNIYAKAERWGDVERVRKLMKKRGIKTDRGSSMIELGGVVREIIAWYDDRMDPSMKDVYLMMERITERVHVESNAHNTSQVLVNVE